ncbi:MAG TPA: ABC transporter substrate-binding protein [Opitutaceae bacterium]|jgi:iron complex transport system substrate-binding protein|nr:ABC transporter substrate-binding protein [Opitutaceae bacterium]
MMRFTPVRPFRPRLGILVGALLLAGGAAAAPVRVVSQTVGTDEALLAVARPEEIAALSPLAHDPEFSAVAGEAARYPILRVGGDAESVLRYRPTVVLCADYSRIELVSQLRTAGVRVVVFDRYATLADAYDMLRRIAAELGGGAPARASAVIADCQRRVAELGRRLEGVKAVRVLTPSTYGLIPGEGTTFEDLCEHAGAINLAASLGHLRGNAPPPAERLLTWPVDELVLGGSSLQAALAPFRALPPYAYLAAVRQGRAVLLPSWVLGCVSYRRVDGYYFLARALHPGTVP